MDQFISVKQENGEFVGEFGGKKISDCSLEKILFDGAKIPNITTEWFFNNKNTTGILAYVGGFGSRELRIIDKVELEGDKIISFVVNDRTYHSTNGMYFIPIDELNYYDDVENPKDVIDFYVNKNNTLKTENTKLKAELQELQAKYDELKKSTADLVASLMPR